MAPTISSFSPASVPGNAGNITTITGTGFSASGTVTAVTVNGAAATWSVTSDTVLVITLPNSNAGLAKVSVTSGAGTVTNSVKLTITNYVFTEKRTRATFTGHFGTGGEGVDVMDLNERYVDLDATTWAGTDSAFLQKQAKIAAVNLHNVRFPDDQISPVPTF